MKEVAIAYIKQDRYFSDKFLSSLCDQSLLNLYHEVRLEQAKAG